MIGWLIDLLSWVLVITGSVFLLIGGAGILRFPDFYSRLEAAAVTDTLCAISILVGLTLQAASLAVAAKLLLTLAFLLFTAPLASLAMAKAARHSKLTPWRPDEPAKGE